MTQARGALPTHTVLDYERTLILAIELSNTSWVLAAQIPGSPPAFQSIAARAEPNPMELTPNSCCARCWRGYAANRVCAQWFRRPLRPMKTPADVCGSDRNSLQSGFAS